MVVQLKSERCEGRKCNKMMMKMFLNYFFFSLLIINITNVWTNDKNEKKERAHYIRPMKTEMYEFIVTLVKNNGVCDIPVSQRTQVQKSALVKFWRKRKANKQFTLGKLMKYYYLFSGVSTSCFGLYCETLHFFKWCNFFNARQETFGIKKS